MRPRAQAVTASSRVKERKGCQKCRAIQQPTSSVAAPGHNPDVSPHKAGFAEIPGAQKSCPAPVIARSSSASLAGRPVGHLGQRPRSGIGPMTAAARRRFVHRRADLGAACHQHQFQQVARARATARRIAENRADQDARGLPCARWGPRRACR